jgi:hypothetical protein
MDTGFAGLEDDDGAWIGGSHGFDELVLDMPVAARARLEGRAVAISPGRTPRGFVTPRLASVCVSGGIPSRRMPGMKPAAGTS